LARVFLKFLFWNAGSLDAVMTGRMATADNGHVEDPPAPGGENKPVFILRRQSGLDAVMTDNDNGHSPCQSGGSDNVSVCG
jgi:hypothetical protein